MAQIEGDIVSKAALAQQSSATESKALVRSSVLKYYIHDSVESCRLQLLGELTEADVPELIGCWHTAKPTLGARKVVLDLRRLRAVDDRGRQWIISMANEGALLLPEAFLRNGLALDPSVGNFINSGFRTRLFSLLRGSRVLPAQSSTPAP